MHAGSARSLPNCCLCRSLRVHCQAWAQGLAACTFSKQAVSLEQALYDVSAQSTAAQQRSPSTTSSWQRNCRDGNLPTHMASCTWRMHQSGTLSPAQHQDRRPAAQLSGLGLCAEPRCLLTRDTLQLPARLNLAGLCSNQMDQPQSL